MKQAGTWQGRISLRRYASKDSKDYRRCQVIELYIAPGHNKWPTWPCQPPGRRGPSGQRKSPLLFVVGGVGSLGTRRSCEFSIHTNAGTGRSCEFSGAARWLRHSPPPCPGYEPAPQDASGRRPLPFGPGAVVSEMCESESVTVRQACRRAGISAVSASGGHIRPRSGGNGWADAGRPCVIGAWCRGRNKDTRLLKL